MIQLPTTGELNSSASEVGKYNAVQVDGMHERPLLKGRLEIGRDMGVICKGRKGERRRVVVDVAGSTDPETKSDGHGSCEAGLAQELEAVDVRIW